MCCPGQGQQKRQGEISLARDNGNAGFYTANPLGLFEKLGQLPMLHALFAWSFLPGTAFHAPQTSLLSPRGLNSLTMLPKVNDKNYAKSQGKCPSPCTTLLPSGAEVLRHENQSTLTRTSSLLHRMKGCTWKGWQKAVQASWGSALSLLQVAENVSFGEQQCPGLWVWITEIQLPTQSVTLGMSLPPSGP